jgi:hypothetical protein
MIEDEDFEASIENEPVFICSQLRAGETLEQRDVDAIQALISQLDRLENADTDTFHRGREDALMQIGGADLVTSVKLKDDESIARMVRKAMDRMFPKEHRRQQ